MGMLTIKDSRLSGATLVPDEFIDYYMPRANGEFVKIYLYIIRSVHGRDFDPTLSHLADVFSCTEKDILRALRYWEKAGLVSLGFRGRERELVKIELLPIKPSLTITQSDPASEQEQAEISVDNEKKASADSDSVTAQISAGRMRELRDSENDSEADDVRTILMFTERYLGKPLSNTDMRRILYFYDVLRFPVDLIDYLVDYCVSHGGRSMNYIEKVGLSWKEEGLTTVKAAKEHSSVYQNKYFAIFRAFGIRNRNPIPDEVKTMDRWLDTYGFSIEIIKEAATRTIRSTGKPSFPYAERILLDWHSRGVHTADDIKILDEKYQSSRKKSSERAASYDRSVSDGKKTGFNSNFHQRDYDFRKLETALLESQEKEETQKTDGQ